jgi:hypothetical protein
MGNAVFSFLLLLDSLAEHRHVLGRKELGLPYAKLHVSVLSVLAKPLLSYPEPDFIDLAIC